MNRRKTDDEKSTPAGISLPKELIESGRVFAKAGGYGGLSGLTRHLLTTFLDEAAQSAESASESAKAKAHEKVKSGLRKIQSRKQKR
jgi:hypothetical protein